MKEQIEEMRDFMLKKSNSANVEPVFTTSEGQEIILGKDLTKLLNDVLEQAFIPFLAEALYSADYRKQSVGEWKKVEEDLGGGVKTYRFACTNCGFLKNTLTGNFCPKCGAKMKGGAE